MRSNLQSISGKNVFCTVYRTVYNAVYSTLLRTFKLWCYIMFTGGKKGEGCSSVFKSAQSVTWTYGYSLFYNLVYSTVYITVYSVLRSLVFSTVWVCGMFRHLLSCNQQVSEDQMSICISKVVVQEQAHIQKQ